MEYFICYENKKRKVSKKNFDTITKMHIDAQRFFVLCKDLFLTKKYSVKDFKTKLYGLELLVILDLMMKNKQPNTISNITCHGGMYFNRNKDVEYIGSNFVSKWEGEITKDDGVYQLRYSNSPIFKNQQT